MDAVAALHPAIEIPDSRFRDFTVVGAAQLIADNGCTEYCVLGPEAPAGWRDIDLAAHPVVVSIDGEEAATGKGRRMRCGDPRIALTWLGPTTVSAPRHVPLAAGDVIITGTCIVPAADRAQRSR